MKLSKLLSSVLAVSEQSAKLARAIRSEQSLFELLVEEKTGEAKNKRFVQDFKTLADVLVQEMVKHHLGTKVIVMKNNGWWLCIRCLPNVWLKMNLYTLNSCLQSLVRISLVYYALCFTLIRFLIPTSVAPSSCTPSVECFLSALR